MLSKVTIVVSICNGGFEKEKQQGYSLLDASVCFLVFSCSRYLDEDESTLIEAMVNCLLVAWTCPEAANYHILLFLLRLPMGCVSSNSVDLSFQCLAQRGNTTYTFLDISSV